MGSNKKRVVIKDMKSDNLLVNTKSSYYVNFKDGCVCCYTDENVASLRYIFKVSENQGVILLDEEEDIKDVLG